MRRRCAPGMPMSGLLDMLEGSKPCLPARRGHDTCTVFDRYAFVGADPELPDRQQFSLTLNAICGNLLGALWANRSSPHHRWGRGAAGPCMAVA